MQDITKNVLSSHYGDDHDVIFQKSTLIQYIDKKIPSAVSSKSRSNFGNLTAIYVLVKDYKEISAKQDFITYDGTKFSPLLEKVRQMPFSNKMQNHALNHRCNMEYKKISKTETNVIIRNQNKYKINHKLLLVKTHDTTDSIIEIIDMYFQSKRNIFDQKIQIIQSLKEDSSSNKIVDFFQDMLSKKSDARLFEITSFVILKNYYAGEKIFVGENKDNLKCENKILYKTGRTNANDGGIDFVMKPMGNFYQVTETLDFKKYFLDIDKINHFPIIFIVKSQDTPEIIKRKILNNARQIYDAPTIKKYDKAIQEIINIPILQSRLKNVIEKKKHSILLNDFEIYLKVEFNM